jgi:hypothetical protein
MRKRKRTVPKLSRKNKANIAKAIADFQKKLPSLRAGVQYAIDSMNRQPEISGQVIKQPEQSRPLAPIPLRGRAKQIADYIRRNPGKPGELIAHDCKVSYDHFRRVYRRKLKSLGFNNARDGTGYFAPDDRAHK